MILIPYVSCSKHSLFASCCKVLGSDGRGWRAIRHFMSTSYSTSTSALCSAWGRGPFAARKHCHVVNFRNGVDYINPELPRASLLCALSCQMHARQPLNACLLPGAVDRGSPCDRSAVPRGQEQCGDNTHSFCSSSATVSQLHQTGSSTFLFAPLNRRSATAIQGPTTGMFEAKPAMVDRKSPNSTKRPYSSTTNPMNVQRSRISSMPAAKAAVPFSFWRRAKNRMVL